MNTQRTSRTRRALLAGLLALPAAEAILYIYTRECAGRNASERRYNSTLPLAAK